MNKGRYIIKSNREYYWLISRYVHGYNSIFASDFKMPQYDFDQILINRFNGVYLNSIDRVCFINRKDAKKALEWVESLEMLFELMR